MREKTSIGLQEINFTLKYKIFTIYGVSMVGKEIKSK